MTKEEAREFFSIFYYGAHHIPSDIKPRGEGWCVNHYGSLATCDFNNLTRLVFLCHDKAVRAELSQSGPNMVKVAIWQRTREGSITEAHPTIENALAIWRQKNTKPLDSKEKV